jgi:hypothetical protein
VNDEHRSTMWSNSCSAHLNNTVTRDVIPYASTSTNYMSCQAERLIAVTLFTCSCCGWRNVKVAGLWDQRQTRETGETVAAIAMPYTAVA